MSRTTNRINDAILDAKLTPQAFFDLNNFEHRSIFDETTSIEPKVHFVWDTLRRIKPYMRQWLSEHTSFQLENVSPGAYLVNPDQIFIGEGSVVEPGAYIAGPAIIGKNCVIRHGAYLRGDVILGDGVIIGHATEVKHAILLNKAHAPHFAYVGDSILGNGVNLGAGTKLSNLALVSIKDPETKQRPHVQIAIGNCQFDTCVAKIGAILGDGVQIGCNAVLNPGSLIGKQTMVYANVSLRKGFYEPHKLIKLRQSIEIAVLEKN